jgi:hypothetical protein
MASKGLGRLDELCFGLSPLSSCRSDDRSSPRDEAGKRAPVLAGNENLTASFE